MSEYYVGRYTVCQGCIFSILTMGNIIFIAFGKNMVKNRKKVGERGEKGGKGRKKGERGKSHLPPEEIGIFHFSSPRKGWVD